MTGPAVRERQVGLLRLLREHARQCETLDLRWLAVGGTLLGAARHGGFIPWDDDVDVAMPREDFNRLDRWYADPAQLPAGLAWRSPGVEPGFPHAYGKLSLTGTDVFMDVFPLDGAPRGALARRIHAVVLRCAATSLGARLPRTGWRRPVAAVLGLVPWPAAAGALARISRAFPYDAAAWVVNAGGAYGYARECQPRDVLEPLAALPFEDLQVPVPADTDAYLRRIYGDYRRLPPASARVPRHAGNTPAPTSATEAQA